jgi:hypothetical protein
LLASNKTNEEMAMSKDTGYHGLTLPTTYPLVAQPLPLNDVVGGSLIVAAFIAQIVALLS